jgi:hypothetical protein
MRHVGNLIHELGHAMGMSHEHTRPDRGNFVKIEVNRMSPMMQAQYDANPEAFTGDSANGFEPYDYTSLMHYPATDEMRSFPLVNGKGVHDTEMGQRDGFSVLDVEQLRLMYKCDEDVGSECIDMDDGLGVAVKLKGQPATCLQVTGYCDDKTFGAIITYFCRAMCNSCPRPLERARYVARVEGCTDASPFCSGYRDFCPGVGRLGNEQWMALNCRKTCHVEEFCGARPPVAPKPAGSNAGESTSSSEVPSTACVDESQTGFLDGSGAAASCAILEDKCRDANYGASIRSKCPATCGVCRDNRLEQNVEDPMPGEMNMKMEFSESNAGFNLQDPAQVEELHDAMDAVVSKKIKFTDTTFSIGPAEQCPSPCYNGVMTLVTKCCSTIVRGCQNQCDVVHDAFLGFTPAIATEEFSASSTGVVVETVQVQSTRNIRLNSIFSHPGLNTVLAALFVGLLVCFCFAITHAHCCTDEREKQLRNDMLNKHLVAGDNFVADDA